MITNSSNSLITASSQVLSEAASSSDVDKIAKYIYDQREMAAYGGWRSVEYKEQNLFELAAILLNTDAKTLAKTVEKNIKALKSK